MRRIFGVGAVAAIVATGMFVVTAPAGATSTGTIALLAGTGAPSAVGATGNGGPATSAGFYDPSDVAVSSSGTVYIADMKDCQVRQVNGSTITAFAGSGTCSAQSGSIPLGTMPTTAASATIGMPTGVAVDSAGNVYIADCTYYTGNGPGCTQGYILKVSGGEISEVVDPAQIGAAWASTTDPNNPAYPNGGVAAPWGVRTAGGNVYFSDVVDNVVDEVSASSNTSSGSARTVAGDGIQGYSGNGGLATAAELYDPTGLYVDGSGNVFIADSKNAAIREVTASNGHIVTIAGTGTQSTTGGTGTGGPATSAELDKPFGVLEDSSGNVYIADYEGLCVREVIAGTISTFAGTCGEAGYNVSTTPRSVSSVLFGGNSSDSPQGGGSNLALTPNGQMVINDYGDNVVDLVTLATVTPTSPTITNIPTSANAGGSFVATVSTTSSGTTSVVSNSSSVCTASGLTVSFVAAGNCSLTPKVAANSEYLAATGTAQSFTISPAKQVTTPPGPVTSPGQSGTPSQGYWEVASDGGIFNYGDAGFYGSTGSIHLNKPIVGMAATPDGKGYWLVASDGGIFNYGDAGFYGSAGSVQLNKPIVAMAATPDGKGYWLVASDGGIFNYGDAGFFGSAGSLHLNKPIVGMAATASGKGYWLVASDGGIFNYGDAGFFGSTGAIHLNKPIVAMASTASGRGYWLVASDGGIFNYGDAAFEGSAGSIHLNQPIVGMGASADGGGYWLVASDGGIFNYGDASFQGSAGGTPLNQPIVGMSSNS
jgi:hypothetical protein